MPGEETLQRRNVAVAIATACLWVASCACAQGATMEPPATAQAEAPDAEAARGFFEWGTPRFGVHLVSHHWPQVHNGQKWNNWNPGLNVRWKNGVTLGTYRNSEYNQSYYGGWTWTGSDCGPALTLGFITGYKKGTLPMAIPSMCVFDHLRFTLIPRLEPKGATVLHLSLEF